MPVKNTGPESVVLGTRLVLCLAHPLSTVGGGGSETQKTCLYLKIGLQFHFPFSIKFRFFPEESFCDVM